MFLCISYIGLPDTYNEEIWENSNRLANSGFFTNREDIPKIKFEEN